MRTESLAEVLPSLTLPELVDVEAAIGGLPTPLCTPEGDGEVRAAIEAGTRDVQALMHEAPLPHGLAVIGALVRRHLPRNDVVVERPAALSLEQSVSPPRGLRCVPGSLTVKGSLSVVAPLIVCGDLVVDGVLRDCGPQSKIVVLGSLSCGALRTTGEIWVLGSLKAARYVWGHYNDNVLEVVGTVRAAYVLSDDHAIEAAGYDVQHRPSPDGDVFDLADVNHTESLRKVTPAAAWSDEGLELDALD
ncbi:MAG: hypothetical protein GQE15_15140 [Archangiaceae bacterium]|nr:hypothetical protein [Archangiaceae bacterium]